MKPPGVPAPVLATAAAAVAAVVAAADAGGAVSIGSIPPACSTRS